MDRARYLADVDLADVAAVVVLFGDNEVGINAPRRWTLPHPSGLLAVRAFSIVIRLAEVSALCRLIRHRFGRFEFSDTEVDEQQISTVVDECRTLVASLRARSIRTFLLLQPNVFTRREKTADDLELIQTYPTHWGRTVIDAYQRLRAMLSDVDGFADLSAAMHGCEPTPYLDWAHINSSGNRTLAEAIHRCIFIAGELHATKKEAQ